MGAERRVKVRLVDADVILKNAQTYSIEFGEYIGDDVRDVDAIFASRIKCAPAVDAVPVMHGKWLNSVAGEKIIKCSKCKTQYYVGATKENTKQYKLCPNCGARMDGKDDENENR